MTTVIHVWLLTAAILAAMHDGRFVLALVGYLVLLIMALRIVTYKA